MSQGHCRGDGGITKITGPSAKVATCDGEGNAVERRHVITGDIGDVMDDIRNPTEDFLTITPEPIPAVSQRRAGVETEEADNRRDDFREEMRDARCCESQPSRPFSTSIILVGLMMKSLDCTAPRLPASIHQTKMRKRKRLPFFLQHRQRDLGSGPVSRFSPIPATADHPG